MHIIKQLIICLGLSALLCGCLELHQEIVLEDAGTGTFEIYAALPLAVYDNWFANPEQATAKRWGIYFDAKRGSTHVAAQPGIELRSYRVYEKNDRLHVLIKGHITNLPSALDSGLLGNWRLEKTADNQQRLTWAPDVTRPLDATPQQIKQLTHGMDLKLTVETPSPIVATSAPERRGTKAIWHFTSAQDAGFLIAPPTLSVTY